MASPVGDAAPPFPLSVMLWTVFTDLPFEERLAKVVEAGYSNVELVGEYGKRSAPISIAPMQRARNLASISTRPPG